MPESLLILKQKDLKCFSLLGKVLVHIQKNFTVALLRAVSLFRFVLQIPLFHALCTLLTQGLLCYNTDQLVSQQSRVCFISLCGLRLTGQISGLIEETLKRIPVAICFTQMRFPHI